MGRCVAPQPEHSLLLSHSVWALSASPRPFINELSLVPPWMETLVHYVPVYLLTAPSHMTLRCISF